jgi:putative CocE/NonD family hydrolase
MPALISVRALACFALPLAVARGGAQDSTGSVRTGYTKTEVRIRARDGAQLFTSIYAPRDTSRTYPILLMRTPYGVAPYGADAFAARLGPWRALQDDGYIFVQQDVRGRYMSDGYYQFMTPHLDVKHGPQDVDESTDTYDTIDWLIRNVKGNNGRVGTWGNSAPGFFVAAGMIDAHPAHKLAHPSAPMIDWYLGDDRHHNGALTLAATFNFLSSFDQPREGLVTRYPPRPSFGTQDGYNFHLATGPTRNYSRQWLQGRVAFWDSIMAHPDYDAYWQRRSIWKHEKNIKPAVLTVGGWFDGEDLHGPLKLNATLEAASRDTRRTFVMGPWSHGAWNSVPGDAFGALQFGVKTGAFFRDSIGTPFFACVLKDRCDTPLPRVAAFATGANQWHTFDVWPPPAASKRNIYLREGGKLSFDAPPAGAAGAAGDRYVSDPARPVPYTSALSFGYFPQYPVEDQRFASRRPDVLVYRTEPLADDLTIAGPIGVILHVATTGSDADFAVKVIDVWPDDSPPQAPGAPRMDGYEQLVRGDLMRARFRRSFERPIRFVPEQADSVSFTLNDVFHTFRKGHRLMVHVQSTWFPLIDRNPQTFVPNINMASEADFKSATMTVFRSGARASHITVGVLP